MAIAKNSSVIFSRVLFHLFLWFVLAQSAPESALVTQLPGFNGSFPSKHYAGYVSVDDSRERNLFYYFVQSEGNPEEDPVVLWLNGGPGCSSFDGFVYEHGPFNFEAAEEKGGLPRLDLNPYSWSKVSNIIYLDSPAGVGFSYFINKTEFDFVTTDTNTSLEAHTFLLKWFELYPEFLSNPFFISGESYAGVYVPMLASEVMKGIDAHVKPVLNLKGYLVGNGVTDEEFDGNALVPFAHGMALISDDLFEEAVNACNGSYYNPVNETCETQLAKIDKAVEDLNMYDILESCYHGAEERSDIKIRLPSSFKQLGETERPLGVRKRMFGRAWPFRANVRPGLVPTWPQLLSGLKKKVPCMDDEVATVWLNNAEVRKAMHVEDESVVGVWELCTNKVYVYHDGGSMIPYHRNLTSNGYSALIFSGDHDMCVPYTGSKAWTRSMGYQIIDEWRPWYSNGQVAGYTQGYANNLTFLTVKGSGHTVPEYKPREALDMYSRFLQGKPL